MALAAVVGGSWADPTMYAPAPAKYEGKKETYAPPPPKYEAKKETYAPAPPKYEEKKETYTPAPAKYEEKKEAYPTPMKQEYKKEEMPYKKEEMTYKKEEPKYKQETKMEYGAKKMYKREVSSKTVDSKKETIDDSKITEDPAVLRKQIRNLQQAILLRTATQADPNPIFWGGYGGLGYRRYPYYGYRRSFWRDGEDTMHMQDGHAEHGDITSDEPEMTMDPRYPQPKRCPSCGRPMQPHPCPRCGWGWGGKKGM